ncbi:MAG: hypothetical protein P8N28_03335 [Phycisphaerales bacterium]|nr:hypothetical protein [Phycisphaerales bacterium]
MIDDAIGLFFESTSLIAFGLAFILGMIGYIKRKTKKAGRPWEPFEFWMLFLYVGLIGVYTFLMHCFWGDIAAESIGWANSPFQWEVGIANAVMGALGLLSLKASKQFRLATVIAASVWFWGDAVGHVYQMVIADNFAPGNAGPWFWTDVVAPFVLIFIHLRNRR